MTTENKPSGNNTERLWGAILIVLGLAALLNQFFPFPFNFGGFFWALFFAGGGALLFTLYLGNREQWWLLNPAYAFECIAAIVLMATLNINGDLIGIFVMLAIATPFYYVYLRNRANWWALIPAYVMTAVAGVIFVSNSPLIELLPYDVTPVYVMFAIALPFYVVYFRNRANWWALIPAGIMTMIGIGLLGQGITYFVPVVLIAIGVLLLLTQMRQGSARPKETQPLSGPEADKPTENKK